MKVLLTAFDAFGGEPINPAAEALQWVSATIDGIEVITLEVPTVFNGSVEVVMRAIRRVQPNVVLCIGQAGGRSDISVERVAINLDDASIADNAGNQPTDTTIAPDGPAAIFATIPVKKLVQAIRERGIPASVSNSAGTFVCNHLFYGVLHRCAKEFPDIKVGFIHIPFLPAQVITRLVTPSMALDLMVQGLEAAIGALAQGES